MNRKLAAPALAMMALAGCNLDRTQVKDPSTGQVAQTVYNSNSDRPGRLLEPRFCRLDTAIVSRPVGDKVIDASPWNVADEQMLPLEARLGLEANGLRAGIITGGLPADLMEAIKPNPPQKETQWVQTSVPEGESAPRPGRSPCCSTTTASSTAATTRTPRVGWSSRPRIRDPRASRCESSRRSTTASRAGPSLRSRTRARSPSASSRSRTASGRTSSASWR